MQYQLTLYHTRISQNNVVAKQIFEKRYDISKPSVIQNILKHYSLYPKVTELEFSSTNTGTQISNFVSEGVAYILVLKKYSQFSSMLASSFFGV